MLKIIAAIFAVIIATVLLLQIDDKLNPDIEPFLAKGIATEDNDAYFYLLGIDAPANGKPLAAGKEWYDSIDKTKSVFDNEIPLYILDATNKLALPEGEYFRCSEKEDCLNAAMFATSDDLDRVLSEHAMLLDRYQTFIKMQDYQSLSEPIASEVIPPYSYLVKGNRLTILRAIYTAQTSGVTEAIPLLMENISALRLQLENADNLIGKMIYTLLISNNLDVVSILSHQQTAHFEVNIAAVSLAERDLELVMSREFYLFNDIFMNLDRNPEFFALAEGLGNLGSENTPSEDKVPGWLVRMVFKPNMTANEDYEFYTTIAARSQLSQIEFASLMPEVMKNHQAQQNQLSFRNFIGTTLLNIAKPNFEEYIARSFDLNAKIALLNQLSDKAELPTNLDAIQNPYYGTSGTAYYSDDGKSICLTGPLEDERGQRCLRVKL